MAGVQLRLSNSPATLLLEGYEFAFVQTLRPERDDAGATREFMPQSNSPLHGVQPLHKHGAGPFCRFAVAAPKGQVGVYALVVDGVVRYIGECDDLQKRFGSNGYGGISPRNCFPGGQPTNCKINHRVLEAAKADSRVDLYFYPAAERKRVEKALIQVLAPAWNG